MLRYDDLKSKLTADSFVENPYEQCVFNEIVERGKQISVILHVDDLMVISPEIQDDLDTFRLYLKRICPVTWSTSGTILDYVGVTFGFTTAGEVRVTTTKVTPGASVLFDVRDAPKATESEAKWFHTHVEDTIPGEEGEASVSDSSSLPVYQSDYVRH